MDLLVEKLDMLLRIFCNGPSEDDVEALRVWFVEVAKLYWEKAERKMKCEEQDILCMKNNVNEQ